MSDSDPLSEQPPLERAIHRLREAQQLHDDGEYNYSQEGASLEMVDGALDDIDEHISSEMRRVRGNSPAHRGESE